MPAFLNPSLVNFTHKQGETLPPAYLIDHYLPGTPTCTSNPNWVDVYDFTPENFKIRLNTAVNSLAAGDYNDIAVLSGSDGELTIDSNLTINLSLQATQFLEVSPNSANFNFEVGGTNPAAKVFSILSENNWTITKNAAWLTLSVNSGSNNGSFTVSVNAVGLTPGTYNDNITVNDGGASVFVPISLLVSDPNTGSDYLNVYPTTLNFGFTEGGALPISKKIDINASAGYTVTTAQAWINLSAATGSAGTATITVTLQNLAALAVGNHIAYIDFTLGTIVKRVTVYLTIYELVSETLSPGLYFTDDENNIKVSSARNDTNLLLMINAGYLGKNYEIPYNIPFFNGVAAKRIGAAADNIIGDNTIFGMADVNVLTPYVPVNINIDINEIETATDTVLQTISLSGLRFLKGTKPLTNYMSNVPRNLFVTKNTTIIFSVLSNGFQSGNLILTGDINQTFTTGTQIFDYYTVVIPLKAINGLEINQTFTATLLNETVTVTIIEEGNDKSILFAETQWGTFETFEFTGEVVETSNYKDSTYSFRKNHLQLQTKVFDRKNRKTYKINTGYIFTTEMIDYLDILLEAENIYLQTKTSFNKVRNTTRRYELRKSLRENNHADLTFENVII